MKCLTHTQWPLNGDIFEVNNITYLCFSLNTRFLIVYVHRVTDQEAIHYLRHWIRFHVIPPRVYTKNYLLVHGSQSYSPIPLCQTVTGQPFCFFRPFSARSKPACLGWKFIKVALFLQVRNAVSFWTNIVGYNPAQDTLKANGYLQLITNVW